jgi:hypothetical protein
MPQPNKRKNQIAVAQDAIAKRRKTSKILEERLKVPKEDSLPVEAMVVPDTISSLHGKKRTPEAEAATNTALPDVATSLPTPIATSIAEVATNTAVTALPDVATSLPLPLPSDDVDVDDDANANIDSMKDTQSNNHPRATDPSTSTQEIKLEVYCTPTPQSL